MVVYLSALSSAGGPHAPRQLKPARKKQNARKKANGSHSVPKPNEGPLAVVRSRAAWRSDASQSRRSFHQVSKMDCRTILRRFVPSLMPKGDLARCHALSNTGKWTSFAIGITTCGAPCLSPMLSAPLFAILASGCGRSLLIAAEVCDSVWR